MDEPTMLTSQFKKKGKSRAIDSVEIDDRKARETKKQDDILLEKIAETVDKFTFRFDISPSIVDSVPETKITKVEFSEFQPLTKNQRRRQRRKKQKKKQPNKSTTEEVNEESSDEVEEHFLQWGSSLLQNGELDQLEAKYSKEKSISAPDSRPDNITSKDPSQVSNSSKLVQELIEVETLESLLNDSEATMACHSNNSQEDEKVKSLTEEKIRISNTAENEECPSYGEPCFDDSVVRTLNELGTVENFQPLDKRPSAQKNKIQESAEKPRIPSKIDTPAAKVVRSNKPRGIASKTKSIKTDQRSIALKQKIQESRVIRTDEKPSVTPQRQTLSFNNKAKAVGMVNKNSLLLRKKNISAPPGFEKMNSVDIESCEAGNVPTAFTFGFNLSLKEDRGR